MSEITVNNFNGVLTVSSLQVAKDFGKQHKHVLEAIENIKAENSAVISMFIESTYKAGTGKKYKCYEITRDGFSLLVMGFTGKKALEWKMKYIEAFNSMEKQLTYVNSDIEKIVGKVIDEKLETIVKKTVKEAVTEAVSETVKVLAPYMKNPEENISAKNRIMCKKRDYNNGKMFNLPKDIRNKVDDMIISGKYSCQKIADFIEKNTGMTISYMTVSRYMKKYFIHK